MRVNIAQLKTQLDFARRGLDPKTLIPAMLSQKFIRNAQTYIAGQMTKGLDKMAGLSEGGSIQVRGQAIRGWATRLRHTSYGDVMESTRYRMRKSARKSVSKKSGATLSAAERKALKSVPPRDRPWEKVWKIRRKGSNVRYSESSEMMRDTRGMEQAFILMTATVRGYTVTLKPGAYKTYFKRQNDRRPMFVLEPGVDDVKIRGFAVASLGDVLRARGLVK